MRRKRMRLVSLILSAVCLLGCAVQPAPVSDSSESNTKVSAYAASQAEQNEEERTEAESLLPQTEDGGDTSESSVAPERANASENADKAAEKQPKVEDLQPEQVGEFRAFVESFRQQAKEMLKNRAELSAAREGEEDQYATANTEYAVADSGQHFCISGADVIDGEREELPR